MLQGLPDYALASAGGTVTGHSRLMPPNRAGWTKLWSWLRGKAYLLLQAVHPHANQVENAASCSSDWASKTRLVLINNAIIAVRPSASSCAACRSPMQIADHCYAGRQENACITCADHFHMSEGPGFMLQVLTESTPQVLTVAIPAVGRLPLPCLQLPSDLREVMSLAVNFHAGRRSTRAPQHICWPNCSSCCLRDPLPPATACLWRVGKAMSTFACAAPLSLELSPWSISPAALPSVLAAPPETCACWRCPRASSRAPTC